MVTLAARPTDAELAARFRKEIPEALKPALALMSEAFASDIVVHFQLAHNSFGQFYVQNFELIKKL